MRSLSGLGQSYRIAISKEEAAFHDSRSLVTGFHGFCLVLLAAAGQPSVAHASGADPDKLAGTRVERPSQDREADFLFRPPGETIGLRVSRLFARADSEIFDFTREQLTIGKSDFDGPAFRVDFGAAVNPRLDVLMEIGVSRATVGSEFRDFVDELDLPIVQQTKLTQVPVSGSLRFWLIPRGREVGQYAWVANTFSPYVGAGAGALWYRFEQEGEFVDFVDLTIFPDQFRSASWTLSTHVFGGASVKLTRSLFLALEARYLWADTGLGLDFVGFDNIDLRGLQITTGLDFVF